ncbi:MAG: hypothetical protein IKS48_12505 [Eubacterium sp.]|nr:hypothetical protein [Eubacterium sp.]
MKVLKKSKTIKSILAIAFAAAILFGFVTTDISSVDAAEVAAVKASYPQLYIQPHVEKLGWTAEVCEGFAGTIDHQWRLEAVKVGIKNTTIGGNVMVKVDSNNGKRYYQTAKCGTMSECCGTTGLCQPVYAISMDLGGDIALRYDVVYRVFVTGEGWTEWVKNGAEARGKSGKIEAIEAHLVSLGVTKNQFLNIVQFKDLKKIGTIYTGALEEYPGKFEGLALKEAIKER